MAGPALPLWAFGFGTPLLLWGLALGGVPLLIHFLSRRRFRETQWAAMRFLLEAVRKNSRRMKLEQLLLLLVRTLILLLVVLALARPRFEELGAYFPADRAVHRILVIDTSFSMGYEPAAQSRFDRAKQLARQIAAQSRSGDALNLVRIAGSEPRVIVANPSFLHAEVIEEIDHLRLTEEWGDIYASIREVAKLLQAAPEIPTKEVVLIGDFQRASWTPDMGGKLSEIRVMLKKIAESSKLTLLDLGQSSSQNNAIVRFGTTEPFITVGRPARFHVGATTFGNAVVPDRTIEFLVDGKVQAQVQRDLQPGNETSVDFTYTFPAGGEHRLQVRLTKDNLVVDDVRSFSAPVKEHIRVLCVNGKLSGDPRRNATFNLELALSPTARAGAATSLMQPRVIKAGELRGFDLSNFDCVFLCDIGSFDATEAEILGSYLKSGGGVIWSLGDLVQPENYNHILYRDGQGILPARIGKRRGDAQKQETLFNFDPLDFSHEIVKAFRGNPDAGLESTRTYEYFATELPESGRSRVALAFGTGDPAIVETQVGAGKSILITTPLDESWGSWALWPSFVPLVQEIVIHAISGQSGQRQSQVGEPLARVIQTQGADVAGTVLRPDGEVEPLRSSPAANLSDFTYDKTDVSGIYELRFGAPVSRTELFAVNVDPRESNLAKLEKDELGTELLSGVNFDYRTDWTKSEERESGPTGERAGLSGWLVYAALYLLFVEQVLAWNFALGLGLLLPPLLPFIWFGSPYRPSPATPARQGWRR